MRIELDRKDVEEAIRAAAIKKFQQLLGFTHDNLNFEVRFQTNYDQELEGAYVIVSKEES